MRVAVVLITSWKMVKKRKVEVKETRAKVFASRKLAEAWAKAQDWGIWREYEIQECTINDGNRHVREDNPGDGVEAGEGGEVNAG